MDEVLEFEMSSERTQAAHILLGYMHIIINLSETDDLVTVMWVNDMIKKERPDTGV